MPARLLQSWALLLVGVTLSLAAWCCAVRLSTAADAPADPAAADAVPKPPPRLRPSRNSAGLTDDQVVAAIQRGVNFLLSRRKTGDHFESTFDAAGNPVDGQGNPLKPADGKAPGPAAAAGAAAAGNDAPDELSARFAQESALVIYALLQAGESIDDSRLRPSSDTMAPLIKWLASVEPTGTTPVSLQAAALALLPKRADLDAALKRDHDFLLQAMGPDGGYENTNPAAANIAKARDLQKKMDALTQAGQDALRRNDNAEFARIRAEYTKDENAYKALQAQINQPRAQKPTPQVRLAHLTYYKSAQQKAQQDLAAARAGGNAAAIDAATKAVAKAQAQEQEEEIMQRADFYPIGDLSDAQFATLGAWSVEQAGIDIPLDYWQTTARFWRLIQRTDGGWNTRPIEPAATAANPAMTAAALASVYLLQSFSDTALRLEPRPDPEIDNALTWLAAHLNPADKDLLGQCCVERVGLAAGYKFFGPTDWYRAAAASIIAQQAADGSWHGKAAGAEPNTATAYAVLFLARGRNPVAFNKLQYAGPWNARPRDSANLTEWLSRNTERGINWQVVNLQVDPEQWLDAPVLLLTGSRDPNFSDADIAKLRAFLQAGGMIFSTSDGGAMEFSQAMRKTAAKVFNNEWLGGGWEYAFRALPRDHPIFSSALWMKVDAPPRIVGITNGIRELWIHCADDMGASWQRRLTVQNARDFQVAANIFFYAAGKSIVRSKLQSLAVTPNTAPITHHITLARVSYKGNWNPEPGAWPRFAKLAQADFHTDLRLTTVDVAKLDAAKQPIAHLTGTQAIAFGPPEQAAIRKYLEDGGFLFVDAGGGSAEFTDAFLKFMKDTLPDVAADSLPADHPIYTGAAPDGVDATTVAFRRYPTPAAAQETKPKFLSFTMNDRLVVVFSAEDLTSAFLGTNTWGIRGYTPDSAEDLTRNLLLWASTK